MNDLSSLALIRGLPPAWRQDVPRRIGQFVVQPASNELCGPRGTVRLRPRLMDVLLRLAAEPGAVIARNRLLEEVWPRRMVSDEVLSRTIAELRTALGDDPRHPSYIETIPTVGYRLVAAVEDMRDTPARRPMVSTTHATATGGAAPTVAIPGSAAAFAATQGDAQVAPALRAAPTAAPLAPPFGAQKAARLSPARGRWAAAVALAALALIGAGVYQHVFDAAPTLAARVANATPFSSEPGLEMEPRFSPDGRRVAYSSSADFMSPAEIVVRDVGAPGMRRVIAAPEKDISYRSPVFVGGSARLAYARCESHRCRIVERDLDTGSERVLVGDAQAPQPNFDVAADGSALVYANMRRPQFPSGLAALDLATGAERDLTLPDAGGGDDVMPRYSPDGTRIAFFRGIGGTQQLWTMNRDGGNAEVASNARGGAYGAAWRDARHVVVAADWFGFRALNEVDLATHAASFVGAGGARFPDIAPGGEIVYENARFRADLWRFDTATATLADAPSWPSTRFTMNPEYSPDGRRVVFVSNREGSESLFVAKDGGTPVRLKLPEGYRYVNAHWSHDGRMLYSMRLGADPPHPLSVVRIDAETGATEPLAALGSDVYEVIPDRAGHYLYWVVGVDPAMRLMRAPLDNLAAQQRLPLPLVDSYMLDATHIAFTQPQIRGLTLCTLEDMACDSLALPINESTQGAWTLGAGAVWYLDQSATPPTLARYDYATKSVTLRTPLAPMAFGRTIAVSPTGGDVLLVRAAPTLIDLMIVR